MSKRAEELAKQLYPDPKLENYDDILVYRADRDNAVMGRVIAVRVYEQAEEDLGWHSVKDKLPGPSEWVVACIEQHGHAQCLTLATYNEETKVWHTDEWEDGEQEIYNPDYWMPIPNIIKK